MVMRIKIPDVVQKKFLVKASMFKSGTICFNYSERLPREEFEATFERVRDIVKAVVAQAE